MDGDPVSATASPAAVLLDLDGTLSDNYPGISRSIAYALERLGAAAVEEAALRRCVGPPLRESFRRLLATDDSATIERAIGFYRERFADVGWQENVMYDGIEATLPLLAAERPCSCARPSRWCSRAGSSTSSASRRTSRASTAPTSPASSTTRRRCSRTSRAKNGSIPRRW